MPNIDPSKKLTEFFSKSPRLKFPKGHVILPAFSQTPGVYYVTSGLVKQYTLTANGQELVVNIYKPGSFFPMIPAMTGGENNFFFESLDACEVHRAPVKETLDFLKNDPEVLMDLIRRLYIGIDGLLQQLTYNAIGSTYQKVIVALVMAAKRFGEFKNESDTVTITRKFTHKEIGLISGTGRESVTRTLSLLQERGLITIDKKIIVIPSLEKLEQELLKSS